MKLIPCFLLLTFQIFTYAQNSSQSINWRKDLRWAQVIEEAKQEHKYIFVDCYTTWCGPCKAMDRDVYTNDSVIKIVNEKFIAIKFQMDRTESDDIDIKNRYSDVKWISSSYTITSYPTFLFFSPDGQPVHKATGYQPPEQFIDLMNDAFNPNKQYYSILKNFQSGKLDTSELKGLARAFRGSGNQLAEKIALDYLNRIPRTELGYADNIDLMTLFSGSKEIRQLAIEYLSGIPSQEFSNTENVKLIQAFKQVPQVQNLAYKYVISLTQSRITKKDLELLIVLENIEALKPIVCNYYKNLTKDKLFLWEHIKLFATFTKSIKDPLFKFFLNNQNAVDQAIKKHNFDAGIYVANNYAETVIDNVVYGELIFPYFLTADSLNRDIDWKTIFVLVKRNTNVEIATRNVINAKVRWYKYKTQQAEERKIDATKWGQKFAIAFTDKLDKYGVDTSANGFMAAMTGNDLEYSIYRYSNDPVVINKAIKWLQTILVSQDVIFYGYVYAGLLYKLGRVKDAIMWQETTIKTYLGDCYQQKKDPKSDYYEQQKEALMKMKQNAPVNEVIIFL